MYKMDFMILYLMEIALAAAFILVIYIISHLAVFLAGLVMRILGWCRQKYDERRCQHG